MTRMLLRETLESLASAYGLGPRAVDAVVSRARLVRVARGTPLEIERGDTVGLVLCGAVRVECEAEGTRVTVQLVGPGRVFHLGWPYPGGEPRTLQVAAHVDAEIAILPAAAMMEILATLPADRQLALLEQGVRGLARRLTELTALRRMSLADRVLARLEWLARDFGVREAGGVRIDVPLTHADVARLVAASRPNVTRALNALERAGTLRVRDGHVLLRSRCGAPPSTASDGVVHADADHGPFPLAPFAAAAANAP